jgi:3-oxoacyl-[acyl-carrier-protein] synthase III
MKARIEGIAYALPETAVTNEMLAAENPNWDMKRVMERTGVATRYICRVDETAFDLACRACDGLFAANPAARRSIDAIIFCTQSGDYIMPPNSCLLHEYLGLSENVFALDFNLACSGFVYGLAVAQGLISAGIAGNVLLVTADTYSKHINPKDRSARVLFGDGAAATWVTASDSTRGLIDLECSTSGKDARRFMIPAGGCRMPLSPETSLATADHSGNMRSLENIHMDGSAILSIVSAKIPDQVRTILERNDLVIEDIDLFLFHQASRIALDKLHRLLRIPPERTFSNLLDIGNTVSASIPILLKDAIDGGRVRRGDRVLLCGFGVGISWATVLLEI